MAENNFCPIIAHAPYTMNPCGADEDLRNYTKDIMAQDIKLLEKINTAYYNFHPGCHVSQGVEVGIEKTATLQAPAAHKVDKPVLFYGSSITQGGCASRPGNNYTSMLCRAVDAEQINMGFSGSARGEDSMAEAIASLDLAVFVYDYDHNAPSDEHLTATHERFFKIIRAKNPELPVIMMNRCDYYDNVTCRNRRDIVRKTYENAIASGDKKVWFIDGESLFEGDLRDACTVDACHPNDLGFFRMYAKVLPVLKDALKNR
jgi:hypothetical protein